MNKQHHIFDNPKNVKFVIRLLFALCALLLVVDFFVHRHISHPYEALPGFYPLYGFIGCVLLVVIAKWLRTLLMRGEDYYKDNTAENKEKKSNANPHGGEHVDP